MIDRPDAFVLAVCVFATTLASSAHGDEVVIRGNRYPGASVFALEQGRVRFRTASGNIRSVWIDEVSLFVIDRGGIFDDFNQAERFLAGNQPQRAVVRYERALRVSESFWPDLIAVRLLLACDAAGRIDQATANVLLVLRGRGAGPPAAARLIPKTIPSRPGARVLRALEQLDTALAEDPGLPQRVLASLLRYEILRRVKDVRAAEARRAVAVLTIPPPAASEPAYTIQLEALTATLEENVNNASLNALDRAIRHSPETILPSFLLLRGKTVLRDASTRDEIIRAAWPFMRVAIHFPEDARAAQGLYGAALALERIGRPDKAVELLDDCLACKMSDLETRRMAEATLGRLRAVGIQDD